MFDHRHLAAALESVSSLPADPIAPVADDDGPVRRRPRVGRSSDPRRRILDALIETVASRGYDRTTIERVLSVAKVPAPVFDEHFENKQDCFLQAIDELIGQLEHAVLEQLRRQAPWPERIQLGLQTLLAELAEHPDGARAGILHRAPAAPDLGGRRRRHRLDRAPAGARGTHRRATHAAPRSPLLHAHALPRTPPRDDRRRAERGSLTRHTRRDRRRAERGPGGQTPAYSFPP